MLAVGVVVVAALYLGRDILVPITIAVLLSFVLAPLVNLLRRLRLGRIVAVILAVLLALSVIVAMFGLIGSQVAQLAGDVPRYQSTIERKIEDVRGATLGWASGLVKEVGDRIEEVNQDTATAEEAAAGDTAANSADNPLLVRVEEPALSPTELARTVLEPILGPLESIVIILIVAIFILLQQDDLRDRMIRLFGSKDLHRTTVAMNDAGRRLSRYFLTQFCLNAGFGVMIGVGLFIIGVPSPILWGILAALMRFVPYIGSFISAIPPVALAAAVDPGWTMVIWTGGLFLVTEPVMGHVVEPAVYGHSTGLAPFSVIVAAIFWTWLWGPIGLILATPLTLCLVVLGRHVERLEFLDVLLGDRPALTPVESFYQRMLANDPDEAADQAELLLKERSLASYYDEVALKGLQLAAQDVQRGALDAARQERLKESVVAFIEEMDEHDDVPAAPAEAGVEEENAPVTPSLAEKALPKEPEPALPVLDAGDLAPAWQGEGAVLCLAGRGPLDEAASTMLAQLLRKHGLGARPTPHEAASRTGIETLDVEGVAMVCVSYLEISGSPSHLRYLLRRLRARLPGVPIAVGLWPVNDPVLAKADVRATINADHYVKSLREALEVCLTAARGPAPGATTTPAEAVPAD